MAAITTKARNALPAKAFAGPDRSYPIDTAARARNALARGAQNASPALQATIKRKVAAKYPGIEIAGKNGKNGKNGNPGNSNSKPPERAASTRNGMGNGGNTYRSSNPPPTRGFVMNGNGGGRNGGGGTTARLAKTLDRRLDQRNSGRK